MQQAASPERSAGARGQDACNEEDARVCLSRFFSTKSTNSSSSKHTHTHAGGTFTLRGNQTKKYQTWIEHAANERELPRMHTSLKRLARGNTPFSNWPNQELTHLPVACPLAQPTSSSGMHTRAARRVGISFPPPTAPVSLAPSVQRTAQQHFRRSARDA